MECKNCPDKCQRKLSGEGNGTMGCTKYFAPVSIEEQPQRQCPIKKLISKITVESIIVDTFVVIFVIIWIFVLKEFINILQMI